MPDRESPQQHFPVVEAVLNTVADWVTRYRDAAGHTKDFGQCSPDDVRQIAHDLGMPAEELREIASKGPNAADLVSKMLIALKVDPGEIARTNPLVMRDLQRLCITCGDKKRCAHELANTTAAEQYHEFCPNALTLNALFQESLERRTTKAPH